MRVGVVMDPIGSINIKKDSTFAMLLEAQERSYSVYCLEREDLWIEGATGHARMRRVTVADNPLDWFELKSARIFSELSGDVKLSA